MKFTSVTSLLRDALAPFRRDPLAAYRGLTGSRAEPVKFGPPIPTAYIPTKDILEQWTCQPK